MNLAIQPHSNNFFYNRLLQALQVQTNYKRELYKVTDDLFLHLFQSLQIASQYTF
jgi:hypothetical protein